MMIRVQGLSRQGFDGSWCARRKWYSAAPQEVEVLDQDDDPPDVTTTILKEGVSHERTYADPKKIGRRSFGELKADATLRIIYDDDSDGALSQAALNAAKAVAADLGGKVAARDAEIAVLKTHIEDLQAALDATKPMPAAPGDAPATKKGK